MRIENCAYEISSYGRCRRALGGRGAVAGRILTPMLREGYVRYNIRRPGTRWVSAHQLVATAFIGPTPSGYVVDHINKRTTDNRVENLRYLPVSENCRVPRKLDWNAVREIRQAKRYYGYLLPLMRKYGVSRALLNQIRRGVVWR